MAEAKNNVMETTSERNPAAEGSGAVIGDFEYRLRGDGTASAVKYLGDDEEVTVPGWIRLPGEEADRQVTDLSIGVFMQKEHVRTVTLSEGIRNVIFSFMMCPALEHVLLPDSFDGNLAGHAVQACGGFRGFLVKPANPLYEDRDGYLIRKENGELVCGPRDRTECVIPEGVSAVGDSAFMYSGRLERVVIPEGVKTIGEQAFAFCPALQEVQLPMSLEDIGCGAFTDCEKLEGLWIPDHTTFAGKATRDIEWIVSDGPVDAGV